MLNLAMIATLNRPHELKLHVKGAIRNGLSKKEISEIFLQVACYAGVPAGVDSSAWPGKPSRSWRRKAPENSRACRIRVASRVYCSDGPRSGGPHPPG